jgi:hypothetical protein
MPAVNADKGRLIFPIGGVDAAALGASLRGECRIDID